MQCYELMNDLGANVAAILDDNQMGYASMDDYVDLARTEKFIEAKKNGEFDLTKVLTRDSSESNFNATWGDGLKMDWTPVAKEDQKCHINWRQSINDDGSNLQRLASFPTDEINSGSNLTMSSSSLGTLEKELAAMEASTSDKLKPLISAGKNKGAATDVIITEIKNGLNDKIKQAIGSQSIDALVIACLYYLTKKDTSTLVTEYANMMGSLGTKNIGLIVCGLTCGQNAIKGCESDNIHPLEEVGKCASSSSDGKNSNGSGSSGDKSSHYDSDATGLTKLNKSNIDSWLWVDYAPALMLNAVANGKGADEVGQFCAVCYLYKELAQFVRTSRYDTDQYAFPYTDEDLKSCNGVEYSGAYGEDRGDHVHRGIDLATGSGNYVPIHAIHDGTVTAAGHGWGEACNAVNIDHGDGSYSRYLHCNEVKVSVGQTVKKGDIIATTGGTGASGPSTYPVHLHLEFGHGDSESAISNTDPLGLFNGTVGLTVRKTLTADGIV